MIKFLDLREKLNTRKFAAFCLFGNDVWVKRKALANIKDALGVDDDGTDYSDAPTANDLAITCLTPSMFCPVRLVVVNNFALPQGKQQADVKAKLADLFTNKFDGGFCVVFDTDGAKPLDIDGVEAVDCNRLDKPSVVKWITAFSRRAGKEADREAASLLADYCLCDMARIAVETQKLVDYGEVSCDAVRTLVHKDVEYAVYDLSGRIANKNAAKAFESYKGLLAQGEENRPLFGLLYNFYRRVYYVKTSGFSDDETANYLGVKKGAIGFAKDVAARYKPMQLRRALDIFAKADAALKAFADEDEVMTQLLFSLVNL